MQRQKFYASTAMWDRGLSVYALAVYAYMSACANADGSCYPSLSETAKKCAISVTTTRKALRELEDSGLILSEPRYLKTGTGRRRQSTNMYHLAPACSPDAARGTAQDAPTPYREAEGVGTRDEGQIINNNLQIADSLISSSVLTKAGAGKDGREGAAGGGSECYIDGGRTGVSAVSAERKGKASGKSSSPSKQNKAPLSGREEYGYGALGDRGHAAFDDRGHAAFDDRGYGAFDVPAAPPAKPYGQTMDPETQALYDPPADDELEELLADKMVIYTYEDESFAKAVELVVREMWHAPTTRINGEDVPNFRVRMRLRQLDVHCMDVLAEKVHILGDGGVTVYERYLAACIYNLPAEVRTHEAAFRANLAHDRRVTEEWERKKKEGIKYPDFGLWRGEE